ncbi:MAG: hypothetical protein KF894_28615 [Labilithrix sp.]|nr:hypothetical protein [Labilithrix sp.]
MKSAAIAVALALLAIACSSTTTTTTTTGNPDGGSSDGGAADGKAADDKDKEEEEEEEEEEGCGGAKTQDACAQCCLADHQAGGAVYIGALQACTCKAENCQEDCADTYCAETPAQPSAKCATCAQGLQQACGQEVTTACNANQDCVAFNKCLVDSGCGMKPQR